MVIKIILNMEDGKYQIEKYFVCLNIVTIMLACVYHQCARFIQSYRTSNIEQCRTAIRLIQCSRQYFGKRGVAVSELEIGKS